MKRWILLALVACAPHRSLPPNRRGVDGKPSDVHTVDGVYGTGTRWFEGACGDATAHAAVFEKFRLEMRAEIPFVPSGDGFGAQCTDDHRMAAHRRAASQR